MADMGTFRGLLRPTISRKFTLFFAALALVALASGLAIDRALTTLDGTSAQINLTGSLRWMARDIEVLTLRLAAGHGNERDHLDEAINRFRATLAILDKGSTDVPPLTAALRSELDALVIAWYAYEAPMRDLTRALDRGMTVGVLENRTHQEATAVLKAADRLTGNLAGHVTERLDEIRTTLKRLVLVDGALLILGLLVIRLRIVQPLRRLAETSHCIADGEYEKRLHYRSDDEIGGLTDACNRLAERVQEHIAALVRENAKLRTTQQELRTLHAAVEHSPATVIVTDRNGRIEYVNRKFSDITGYRPAEALGQTPRIMKSHQMSEAVYADMWQTLNAGREWRGHLLNRKKNGALFWEDTWISPIRNAGGEITHFVAVKDDITDKKRIEEERRRMNQILEQRVAQRTAELATINKELEAFSYSVSHDLRAPLRAIHGFSHLLDETCSNCPNPEAREFLERIKRASVRMGDIIDDLLELSRISRTELRLTPVNLSSIARIVLDELARAEPGRRFAAKIQDGVVVTGDPGLLRIALENLFGNAWKFTARREVAEITLGATAKMEETVVFVRDNGAGFNMEFADKLFLPFQRLHHPDDYEGTGIGLATVRRIVQMHGGRVWAEGAPRKGATFYFAVPNRCHQPMAADHSREQHGPQESETRSGDA